MLIKKAQHLDCAVLELLSGAPIGIVAGFAPVFHWEMAALFLVPFTCLGGSIAGLVGAAKGVAIGGLVRHRKRKSFVKEDLVGFVRVGTLLATLATPETVESRGGVS